MLLLCIAAATAQDRQTSLKVKADFMLRDSMMYTFDFATFDTDNGDTVCTSYLRHDFMLTVVEKGPNGYLLDYIPMECSTDPKVKSDLKNEVFARAYRYLYGMHLRFFLDRNGGNPKLKNWQEVRNKLIGSSRDMFDKLASERPDLMARSEKDSLRGVFNLQHYTEEGLMEQFSEIGTLFTVHGDEYDIGEKLDAETDSTAMMHLDVSTSMAGEYGFQSDYNIFCETMSHSDGGKAEESDILNYAFFYNGWPKSMQEQHIESNYMGKGRIETKVIEWHFRSWNNFF